MVCEMSLEAHINTPKTSNSNVAGDVLKSPSVLDLEAQFLSSVTFGSSVLLHPSLACTLLEHSTGKASYQRLEEERKDEVHPTTQVEFEHGGMDDYGYGAEAGEFERENVEFDELVSRDAIGAGGFLADDVTANSKQASSASKLASVSGQTFGKALTTLGRFRPTQELFITYAADDNASVGSRVTRNIHATGVDQEVEEQAADAFVSEVTSAYVEKGKWHPQTVAMFRILAEEMTGPEVPAPTQSGRKRKAKEISGRAIAPNQMFCARCAPCSMLFPLLCRYHPSRRGREIRP
jgi:hypothetical protein